MWNESRTRILSVVIGVACAQVSAQEVLKKDHSGHSITGFVREVGVGRPIQGARLVTLSYSGPAPKRFEAETDPEGRYTLAGVPSGDYTVLVAANRQTRQKRITINGNSGTEVKLDFDFAAGAISGLVRDDRGQPLSGASVILVGKQYQIGILQLVLSQRTMTNDTGEYEFRNVDPHQSWFVRAEPRSSDEDAISRTPINSKARKPALVPTWYPGSPDAIGASAVRPTVAGRADGVDIRVLSSPNLCIDGVLEADGSPAPLGFVVEEESSSGLGIAGQTGSDGRFRKCGFFPGAYRITAGRLFGATETQPPLLGTIKVSIGKTDVSGIRIAAQHALSIDGAAEFDSEPAQKPACNKFSMNVAPVGRYHVVGESTGTASSLPGHFSLSAIFLDNYVVEGFISGTGCYLKEVRYAGLNLLREPLEASRINPAEQMHIVVGLGGASLETAVRDADGNGVPDANVALVSEGVRSERQLATSIKRGQTDQNGMCSFGTLAPGKYRLLATPDPIELTPDSLGLIAKILAGKATEVELGPGQNQVVSLSPTALQ